MKMRWSNLFRFRLQSLFILMLGIAIGYALNLQTLRILFGPPTEARMTSLPPYEIEPPDILNITVTVAEGEDSVEVVQQCLVAPDGRINLGASGTVYVSGMKIEEAGDAIRQVLEKQFPVEEVYVDILAYNSKLYYVIEQGNGPQDTVTRLPITGNETVLDAIANMGGVPPASNTRMWVNRPAAHGVGSSQVLPVSWDEITDGTSTSTNYQLLPGDRLFISRKQQKQKSQKSP